VRGLFSGGTLRDEALAVMAAAEPVALDREADGEHGHVLVDYGSERLTVGRAHPMIDPSLRNAGVARAAEDPDTSVLLVDVVLGRAAHPDPATELAPVLAARPDGVAAVVSLCGSSGDPQGLDDQAERLRAAGAVVTRSNAEAARLALAAATASAEALR
jgi:FdrA protein